MLPRARDEGLGRRDCDGDERCAWEEGDCCGEGGLGRIALEDQQGVHDGGFEDVHPQVWDVEVEGRK